VSDRMVLTLWAVFTVGCMAAGFALKGTLVGVIGGLGIGCLAPFIVLAFIFLAHMF